MNTWALDDMNDLELMYGQIKLNANLQALKTRIDAALQVVKGEVASASEGVDYFGIIFSNTPVSLKVQEICRVINDIEGVDSVTFEKAEMDKVNLTFRFYFTIYSTYGEFDYDKLFVNPAQ